jgi:hypothetical protein
MRNAIILLLLLVTGTARSQQPHATGLKYDDNKYLNTSRLSPALKFSGGSLPFRSLKEYCPRPGNQHQIGSCTAWATGYAAMTISMAIRNNITDKDQLTRMARSALYIYKQIKTPDDPCFPGGATLDDALKTAQSKGDCLLSDFDPDDCNARIPDGIDNVAAKFKIKDYYTLFEKNDLDENKITATINSLNSMKPVVVGMDITNSLNNVDASGQWNPAPDEIAIGGHALCVIGYNNSNKRFEIMNSWGPAWGNGGFFTISYKDFVHYCRYAYQLTLASLGNAPVNKLGGQFEFLKFFWTDINNNQFEFRNAGVQFDGSTYSLSEPVKLNDFFRIAASHITRDQYVYIFSLKPDNTTEILFPTRTLLLGFAVHDLPIVPSLNATLEIPTDEHQGLTTDQAGQDILCILYSTVLIDDIETVVKKVEQGNGDINQRLSAALGSRLISPTSLTYNPNLMAVTGIPSAEGKIAPLILKVNVQP